METYLFQHLLTESQTWKIGVVIWWQATRWAQYTINFETDAVSQCKGNSFENAKTEYDTKTNAGHMTYLHAIRSDYILYFV